MAAALIAGSLASIVIGLSVAMLANACASTVLSQPLAASGEIRPPLRSAT
jgi:hypothetical protein